MRDDFDRFYTQDHVAQKCIDTLFNILEENSVKHDIIVEPSAGGGAFSSKIEDCIAFDLEPSIEGIIQQDWLTTNRSDFRGYKNMLIVGNPPFGKRSTLAKSFIKHSIQSLDAQTIAFILPKTFNKRTNQKAFPDGWRLIKEIDLSREDNHFELFNEGEIFIPCSFYIWTKLDKIMPNVDHRKFPVSIPRELIFLPRNSEDSDIVVNGNNGKVKLPSEVTNPKSEHFIKIHEDYDKEEIIEILSSIEYEFHSSVNGGVAWLNKEDISEAFNSKRNIDNT